jgi:hypothetical protein
LHVEAESLGDARLRDSALDRALDHPMLLDRRQPIDTLVVGVGVVCGRDEARDVVSAEVLQGLDPEVTVPKEIFEPAGPLGRSQHLVGDLKGIGIGGRTNDDRRRLDVRASLARMRKNMREGDAILWWSGDRFF